MTRFTRATRIAVPESAALQRLLERKGLVARPALPRPTLSSSIVTLPKLNG